MFNSDHIVTNGPKEVLVHTFVRRNDEIYVVACVLDPTVETTASLSYQTTDSGDSRKLSDFLVSIFGREDAHHIAARIVLAAHDEEQDSQRIYRW